MISMRPCGVPMSYKWAKNSCLWILVTIEHGWRVSMQERGTITLEGYELCWELAFLRVSLLAQELADGHMRALGA